MNAQFERLFHSIRRGIEENVRLALRNLEVPSRRDFRELKRRIDRLQRAIARLESFRVSIATLAANVGPRGTKRRRRPARKRGRK
jgi:hypothetical protein